MSTHLPPCAIWTGFFETRRGGKRKRLFLWTELALTVNGGPGGEQISYVCLPDFSGRSNDSMTHDLSEVNSGGRL